MAQMVVEPTTPVGSGPRAIATEAPLSPRHTGRLRLPGGLGQAVPDSSCGASVPTWWLPGLR